MITDSLVSQLDSDSPERGNVQLYQPKKSESVSIRTLFSWFRFPSANHPPVQQAPCSVSKSVKSHFVISGTNNERRYKRMR